MPRYRIKGFLFDVPLDLPKLPPEPEDSVPVDARVRFGEVAQPEAPTLAVRPTFHLDGDALIVRQAGRFRARISGHEICLANEDPYSTLGSLVSLLSIASAAMVTQRGGTVLHAAAMAMCGGQGAVFCAPSGTGKSTLAAALHGRGHRFLADDSSLLDVQERGQYRIVPVERHVRLLYDAMARMGLSSPHPPSKILKKSRVTMDAPEQGQAAPLAAMFMLQRGDGALCAGVAPMDVAEAAAILSRQCFHPPWAWDWPRRAEWQTRLVERLARDIPAYRVTIANEWEGYDTLLAEIERQCAH